MFLLHLIMVTCWKSLILIVGFGGEEQLCVVCMIRFFPIFLNKSINFFPALDMRASCFLIGHALNGKIDMEKKEIFGPIPFHQAIDSLIGPANEAVSFYDSQLKSARLAVDTWTLVATRLHVIKDMRILIGKMIWKARFEANYEFDLDEDPSSVLSPQTLLLSASSSAPSPVLKRSRK